MTSGPSNDGQSHLSATPPARPDPWPKLLYVNAVALVSLALLVAIVWALARRAAHPPAQYAGIQIEGTPRFVQQVQSALELLQSKAPSAFQVVERHVGLIRQARRSGMQAQRDPPTFDMADPTAFHSLSWCAGSIAHDSYHSLLFQEHRRVHGDPVPDDAWTGTQRELECIIHQIAVMRDIGAPQSEIDYLNALDGTHYDTNGDGQSTWSDYRDRNW